MIPGSLSTVVWIGLFLFAWVSPVRDQVASATITCVV